jgi:3-phytase/alkaline phosphatase D
MHRQSLSLLLSVSIATTLLAASTVPGSALAAELPNGVAAGDVTRDSAVLWARASKRGAVRFQVSRTGDFRGVRTYAVPVADATVPAKLHLEGLQAGTTYYYRATDAAKYSSTGRFRTPPAACSDAGVRFGVSGDWRGELAPYPAIRNAAGRDLDFFVAHGDTIYAENYSVPGTPTASTLEEYRALHDLGMTTTFGLNTWRELRGSTALLATIDDHEVVNDFAGGAAPSTDPNFAGQAGAFINETTRYQAGLQAFHEYMPVQELRYGDTGDARTAGKLRLFRERTYGNAATVMVLDNRSFRDQGLPPVTDLTNPAAIGAFLVGSFNPARTMLGAAQKDELKAALLRAQQDGVAWKFVMVPEPIQNLGVVAASDRFEGYAAERTEILKFVDEQDIDNVVFVAADIHGTLVNNLTYQLGPFQPQIGLTSFEISTGAVAFDAPFGPTVVELAAGLGLLTPAQLAFYNSLPVPFRDVFVNTLVDQQVVPFGYDPVGLTGSPVNASLSVGGYVATHTYGWTEFEVDRETKALQVTTYGVPPYDYATLQSNPSAVTALQPVVVSQFSVVPVATGGNAGSCGSGG